MEAVRELRGQDLAVNDSDGEHRKCQLVWSGNQESYRDRSHFRLLRFADFKKSETHDAFLPCFSRFPLYGKRSKGTANSESLPGSK